MVILDSIVRFVLILLIIVFAIAGFLLILNLIALFIINIKQISKLYGIEWNNLKLKSKEFIIWFQQQDFSYYVDLSNIIIISVSLVFVNYWYYTLLYLPLYLTTKTFIWLVKDILVREKTSEKITEFWFFVYVTLFSLIMLTYIFSFSLFYNDIFSLNYGYMSTDKESFVRLNFADTFLYSGFTFFSMEYKNFIPQKAFAWFTFAELFISQILLITFIGIMASKLIDKINLNILRNDKTK